MIQIKLRQVEHWGAVRESAATVLSLAIHDCFGLMAKVAECEDGKPLSVETFTDAARGIHKRSASKTLKPAHDIIAESGLARVTSSSPPPADMMVKFQILKHLKHV